MENPFFDRPIINSPYEYPSQHWELDKDGQPTQQIIESRRGAEFITPIPKPRQRGRARGRQQQFVIDEGLGLSTEEQQYDVTAAVNEIRRRVDEWRNIPGPNNWGVTPETARLLLHWRQHKFSHYRPFFCQIEAVETLIWLTEVAPRLGMADRMVLDRLADVNQEANPELSRIALKLATGAGNLFVIFGEPDIDILDAEDGQLQVKVNGVDVFHPNTGEVRSDGPDGIACWLIDTDYNQESFFVRHAYFLGASDPYRSLKTTLKAEIDEDAWATLNSATSRPFPKPESGRIAVKVINHLGDEVMKVFRVG